MNFKDDEMRQIGTAYMITQSNQFVGNFFRLSILCLFTSFGSSFGSPVYTFFWHTQESLGDQPRNIG